MRPRDAWCWVAMLLLALFSNTAGGRRGAGGRAGGRGGGGGDVGGGGLRGGFWSISRGGNTAGRSSKMASAIAAGAAAGYGMGFLGRLRAPRLGLPSQRQLIPAGGFYAAARPNLRANGGSSSPIGPCYGIVPTLLLANAICWVNHGM